MLGDLRARGSKAILVVAGVVPTLAVVAAAPGPVYREGPPPGFSGGFGEASCAACHFSTEENTGPGTLTVDGLPERYAPGDTYELVVTLARTGLPVGGFALTARFAGSGAQAGTLLAAEPDRLTVVSDRDVEYALQTTAGSSLVEGVGRWAVRWTAPAGGGEVQLNVAANAADGDGTAEGDEVYTTSVAVQVE